MKVKLTNEDVLEACREWIEKHHGLVVKQAIGAEPEITAQHKASKVLYKADIVNIEFTVQPRPGTGCG